MRRYFIAGNWKMNAGPKEAEAIIESLKKEYATLPASVDTAFCPPFISIPAAVAASDGYISIGSQDVHFEDNGAFTGAISTAMLNEVGCTYAIVGHSERREYFGETDETVNLKTKKLLADGITPIVCVGETLEQRKNEDFISIVKDQVADALAGLSDEDAAKVVVAYEPIWAIGTGETATPEQAQDMHAELRDLISEVFNADVADKVRILYGGSMKAANADELLSQKDVDGGLIGGASLDGASFAAIIKAAEKLS